MPYSDEEIIQRLSDLYPGGWQLQDDKFISNLVINFVDPENHGIFDFDGHELDFVQVPGGYSLSIPRALANEIFEQRDAAIAANMHTAEFAPMPAVQDIPQQGQPQLGVQHNILEPGPNFINYTNDEIRQKLKDESREAIGDWTFQNETFYSPVIVNQDEAERKAESLNIMLWHGHHDPQVQPTPENNGYRIVIPAESARRFFGGRELLHEAFLREQGLIGQGGAVVDDDNDEFEIEDVENAPVNDMPEHDQEFPNLYIAPEDELEDIPQQGQPQWEDEIAPNPPAANAEPEQNPPAANPEPEQNEAPPSPRPRNR